MDVVRPLWYSIPDHRGSIGLYGSLIMTHGGLPADHQTRKSTLHHLVDAVATIPLDALCATLVGIYRLHFHRN